MADDLILIVDDVVDNLNILSDLLKMKGYDTLTATSGEIALELLKDHKPNLVLLDISMPGMDGYQVCEKIKSDGATCDIVVIFMSALHELKDRLKAFEVGGIDYITKPFQLPEVLMRVENHLALARQRDEIRQLSELKDDLLRIVSHDLKSPISLLTGYIHLLVEEITELGEPAEHLQEWLSSMLDTTDFMFSIVSGLLDISRIEAGIPLIIKPTDLNKLLRIEVNNAKMTSEKKALNIYLDVPEQELIVNIDEIRFRQVISNLISNAIKYTPSDGEVFVKAYIEEGSVILEVIDTGLGIPEEDMDNIFQKFYRLSDEAHLEAAKGTGLGLTVTRGIVEQHGGTIKVFSEVNKGSTFRIELPMPDTEEIS